MTARIESPTMNEVSTPLGRWRHLPSNRLEPRLYLFFALVIRPVIASYLGVEREDTQIVRL